METLSPRLQELVRKLDLVATSPTLVDLAEAMESTGLTLDDVRAFIKTNPQSYNRATVVLREQYELLVMTWLPGQGSVPHDHAGSICVMQVVQGEAAEASYRVAADGYVDLEYETTIRCGEVSAGQDASVHTVRNPSASEQLVTVHVYVPPLKEFRRFVARPAARGQVTHISAAHAPTVVVIGGGFSGSVTAAQIMRRAGQAKTPLRVVLVERRGAIGEGLAYATRDLCHLLNVPAGRMSAWPDRPDDFLQWACERYGPAAAGDFLPRQWYGEYMRDLLLAAAHDPASPASLSVVLDEVRRVSRHPSGGWMVHLARGSSIRSDAVVLAIGHRSPTDPIGQKWSGPRTRFIADPWRQFAMNAVRPDESVVALGSGLTAVDAVLSLAHPTRRAPITLLSRNGLVPRSHATTPVAPVNLQPLVSTLIAAPGGLQARALFRELRREARKLMDAGGDWRGVVDGLRPHTAAVWGALSTRERRRFLSRLRPFWEVHRHRMAPSIAEQFKAMLKRGEVRVLAGRVVSTHANEEGAKLIVADRGSGRKIELDASWVVNCTGPAPSNSAVSNPAIGSLLVHGWLRRDELELGIETTSDGSAVDTSGRDVADLFVVGTLRKPALWESTAVPELRTQAATVAERVCNHLASCAASPPRPHMLNAPQRAASQPHAS